MTRILKLNESVLFFHKTRQSLSLSLALATKTSSLPLISILKKKLDLVRKIQSSLLLKQKYLLAKSVLVKKRTLEKLKKKFKKLNVSDLREETFYKRALAIERKKEGDKAYTYKPVPDFINHQKSQFSWKMHFSPLGQLWFVAKPGLFAEYKCTASLKKKGGEWLNTLYH